MYRQGEINFIINAEPTALPSVLPACTAPASAPSPSACRTQGRLRARPGPGAWGYAGQAGQAS
ncbi:hypothetical protein [Comamonas sp. JC664]|uniref:hypothetical protein n=1 Tax=Comamonas sp. JC664 TaxID=2801917 RepID=UPI00360B521F